MTEKQFKVTNISENGNIGLFWLGKDNLSVYDVVRLLNELYNENEQLNQEYLKLKHRHSLLHDVCLDAECERDSLKKDVEYLEEENERLKSEINMLKTTIGRNETYIQRIKHKGEWR